MKNMNEYLSFSPEVREAMEKGKPIVALESTIISHGMPYPKNVETAVAVEQTIRDNGAVPATIAIIKGRLMVGLTPEELEYFGKKGTAIAKVSRRDIPVIVARGEDGATTVAATMIIAHMAGIQVFATGGIGGVHRGAEKTMDISADLDEFSKTPVMVVCAGAKAILDLNLTMEYLETKGVPVFAYQTDELPAFYSRKSGIKAPFRSDSAQDLAAKDRPWSWWRRNRCKSNSTAVQHGQRPHKRSHRRGHSGDEQAWHPRQGDHSIPFGQNPEAHRWRQP